MRVPLVDGQGNFGSMDGDSPAAMRYTEARFAKAGEALLEDIDKETVDYQPNYDESLQEPLVLPARFPGEVLRHRNNFYSPIFVELRILPHPHPAAPGRYKKGQREAHQEIEKADAHDESDAVS